MSALRLRAETKIMYINCKKAFDEMLVNGCLLKVVGTFLDREVSE